MKEPTKPGEMKGQGLNLKQTESVRQGISNAAKARYALLRLKAAKLDWKTK